MIREESSVSKSLYKVFIWLLKKIPCWIALLYIVYTMLSFFYIELGIIGYIASCSLLTWMFLYVSSFVFKFCIYHRIPLYYIALNDLINIVDLVFVLPVNTLSLMMVHIALIGIFTTIYIYFKRHERGRQRFAANHSR